MSNEYDLRYVAVSQTPARASDSTHSTRIVWDPQIWILFALSVGQTDDGGNGACGNHRDGERQQERVPAGQAEKPRKNRGRRWFFSFSG